MFDCYGPVSGEMFLFSDMTVKCFQGSHWEAMAMSGVWLIVWAIISPLLVYWVGRWKKDLHKDLRFSFLFGELLAKRQMS